ncbi:23S rRNA (pseudouridine(1915)-N(3))-methyltransferase RlmH [Desulforamulus hydrothermalis]|uniref:Ribosomal RNA large subunit methyltransferase H n=1 Tax=Desulforamulus hydrothermalis Lam5 = DSM 18033 TaxID=1121428 RepID=K8EIC0_9FIRM|nr:23S rRNA (pseudouridine(1915)-N(3))-methyltransferase RlmH [Desulforamulus hydrothermalis]CCO08361.1 Ribosomal RNA large subunit methyltransferase H [Desulforamulus hydrothermalis Lam5 = DSM 18033]SHH13908.1 23S rRNA (pseudouridine1915-N3)-methyltransferase [Desulforamulus hydrothermalis Lam5 = DSM 18033]
MKISILAVGKLKEKYLEAGIQEYLKRLTPYARLDIVEVPDESCADHAAAAEEDRVRRKEAGRLLKRMRPGTFLIVLDPRGRLYTSEEMAQQLQALALKGRSDVTFIIGGSLGLAPEILQRADITLSFSKLIFPHQLMRLMLLEQIYRWFKIIKNEPYHK